MVNYRRRNQETQDIPDSIFESITPKTQKTDDGQPNIADLMRQLGELGGEVKILRDNLSLSRAQASPASSQTQIQMPEAPKLSLDNLPDPVTQKEDYAREIARRTLDYASAQQHYTTQVAEMSRPKPLGNVDALWTDFVDVHAEYAADDSKFRYALAETAKKLGDRGVDFGKYLFTDTERAFAAIMEQYDRTFGSPEVDGDEGFDDAEEAHPAQVAQRKRARPQQDNESDDGRTDGIPGGGDRGAIPQIERQPAGDMLKDMRELQVKSGYF